MEDFRMLGKGRIGDVLPKICEMRCERVYYRNSEEGSITELYHRLGERMLETEEKTSTPVDQSTTELGVMYEESKLKIDIVVF